MFAHVSSSISQSMDSGSCRKWPRPTVRCSSFVYFLLHRRQWKRLGIAVSDALSDLEDVITIESPRIFDEK